MHPAAAVQLVLVLVTVQAGNILPIVQVKHLFHGFGFFFANSASSLIKGCSSDVLEYALCPPEGKRAVAPKKTAEKLNAFFFQSSRCTSAFPVPCIKLAEIESSDRSCSQNISQECFSVACIIKCTIPSSPSPRHDFFHT